MFDVFQVQWTQPWTSLGDIVPAPASTNLIALPVSNKDEAIVGPLDAQGDDLPIRAFFRYFVFRRITMNEKYANLHYRPNERCLTLDSCLPKNPLT